VAIQASKPNSRVFLLLGIVLAALAFGGVLFALRQSGGGQSLDIIVTKGNIPAGTAITADMVTSASVPTTAVPADAYTASSSVVGKTTTVAVAQNTPLVPAFFSAPPLTAATTTGTGTPVSVETQITKGFVALAIPTASGISPIDGTLNAAQASTLGGELVSVGYYIQPGDHIDILVDTGAPTVGTRFAFQDIPVLRVGTSSSAANATPSVLIVEVARSQAALLTQLVTAPGHPFVVKYVLRPQTEWGKMAPDGSSYTPNYEASKGPAVPAPGDTTTSPSDIESLFGH
jgi:Flp pilus assembly protein CpaB